MAETNVPPGEDSTARKAPEAGGENCAPVPLVERCPECGQALDGWSCKVYCLNPGCALFRRVIENCAGD